MGKFLQGHPGIIQGWQRIVTAGAAISIDTSADSPLIKAIIIVSMDNNSSQVLMGSSEIVASSQVRGFDAGKGLDYSPTNIVPIKMNTFFINGGASSDGVDFYAIKAE